MQTKADVVFQDNFASGSFDRWTTVGSPNLVTSPVVDGSQYAAKFPVNPSAALDIPSTNISYLQAPFTQSEMANLEFYFQTDTTKQNVVFAEILNGESSLQIYLSPFLNNDSMFWAFTYPFTYPTGESGVSTKIISANLQIDVWYKFNIAVADIGTNGTVQFSINDSPVISATNIQFHWNPTVFKLGTINSAGNSTGNIYIDDVTETNTANFPQSTSTPSPTPSQTAQTSPSSTVTNSSPSPSNTSNSSPQNVPEFPTSVILPFLAVVMLISTVFIRKRKPKK